MWKQLSRDTFFIDYGTKDEYSQWANCSRFYHDFTCIRSILHGSNKCGKYVSNANFCRCATFWWLDLEKKNTTKYERKFRIIAQLTKTNDRMITQSSFEL